MDERLHAEFALDFMWAIRSPSLLRL